MTNWSAPNAAAVLAVLLAMGFHHAHSEEPATESAPEVAPAAASSAGPDDLARWLVELDSRRFAEREAATDALLDAGAPAVPYLRQAAHGTSLEAADRAVWVLEQLAESNETPLKLAALNVLVATERFPSVVREAEAALAELQEQLCRSNLEALGAEFSVATDRQDLFGPQGLAITVNANTDEWHGTPDDLMQVANLRQVSTLKISASDIEDKHVANLATMEGLAVLELIETKATPEVVRQLKQQRPELRVRLRSRALLGVVMADSGAPVVQQVKADTPAAKAGFQSGDTVLAIAGHPVDSFDELTTRLSRHAPGETVSIEVLRDTEKLTLDAKLIGTDWTSAEPTENY